ncbi:unnamed protein product [Pocillopora meandrina]|uniref:DNA-directed DNA polymerase n=1 Tax=Pocillopora meandrina TaxID=46732 RepID=A0AAU9X0X1_9CNID|nr:unnamed protein product [Pocillopora meandrina]
MAKRKFDEVEYGDDGILDDLLNEIGEVFENQYGNDVTDSQMVQFGRELDQQQLDALDIGLDEHPEQIGGGMPLFEFDFQKFGLPKRWKKSAANQQRYRATLKQRRNPTKNDNVGKEVTEALVRSMKETLHRKKVTDQWQNKTLKDTDEVFLNFKAEKFDHHVQTQRFTVGEIMNGNGEERFGAYMNQLANQLNSNESFSPEDKFAVDLTIVPKPKEGGKSKLRKGRHNIEDVLHNKQCVLPIKNSEDNLCLARAICLTKAHLHKDDGVEGKRYYKNLGNNPNVLTRCAKFLHKQAGVPEGPCGRAELEKFQQYLAPDYQLKVMTTCYPYCITFQGNVESPKYIIRLLYQPEYESDMGHYHGCTSYLGFLERSYFCDTCNKGFDHDDFRNHPCEGRRCKACKQTECGTKPHEPTLHCSACNRHFYSQNCLALHCAKNICMTLVRCGNCCKQFQPDPQQLHRCYFGKCSNCKEYVDLREHKCYIQPIPEQEDSPKRKTKAKIKRHLKINPEASLVIEGRKFDVMIPNGTKMISLEAGKITFKDSMAFLPMALSAFTDTFGLTELKKGFFPHKFHTQENRSYVGPLPEVSYYDPEGMSSKKKEEFEVWYREEAAKQHPFDLKEELLAYCHSDVVLLKAGCHKFIQEFKSIAGFNPMEKCVTIAAACNRYWRRKHLPLDLIAVEPSSGWRGARMNHSKASLEWLMWQEYNTRSRIQHARNGEEYRIAVGPTSYFVDGYDAQTRTVYKFHGCLYHGCRTCYTNRKQIPFCSNGLTVEALRQQTSQKIRKLRGKGYRVVEIWGCEWEKEKKETPVITEFLKDLDIVPPLNPREGFYGGRTGAACLYHKVNEEEREEIRYIDVTSEYPYVNKYGTYPVGHPDIYLEPENQDPRSYFGLMTVDITPPADLYNPVLPYRHKIGNSYKLTFPLCRKCVEIETQKEHMLERDYHCPHSDEERMLRGTWYSVIYTWKPGQTEIELGDYLGDMTNELDNGDFIVEFISAGAKNYGYQTKNGKVVCKVKGFSLNVRGAKQLNYDIIRQNILDEVLHPLDEQRKTLVVNPTHFVRNPTLKKIKTETQTKSYQLVFDKRVLDHSYGFKSYPYGYSRLDAQDLENMDLLLL